MRRYAGAVSGATGMPEGGVWRAGPVGVVSGRRARRSRRPTGPVAGALPGPVRAGPAHRGGSPYPL